MFSVLFVLYGCGQKTNNTLDDSGITDTQTEIIEVDCPRLQKEECESTPACAPIMGSPITYNENESCWNREELIFVECMSAETSCGQSIIHARPTPNDACMMFPNMCIPIAWSLCSEQEFIECES